jgi:small-conductance mechanosensitive channel
MTKAVNTAQASRLVGTPGPGHASDAWGWALASSLAAAGGLHVAAALALDEGALATAFFWLSAAGQFGAAVWMAACLRTRRSQPAWWTALTLVGTIGLIALYVLVHGTDLLSSVAGHHHEAHDSHTAQAATAGHQLFDTDLHGLLGAGTVAVELITVLASAALLPIRWRRASLNGLLASAGLLWALWLAGVIG